MIPLAQRIARETGKRLDASFDPHSLSGIFDAYRPSGRGLERLLSGEGIEGEVRSRLQRVFDVTSASWQPGHWYFVITRHEPIDTARAAAIANAHLAGIRCLAEHAGNSEVIEALDRVAVVATRPANTSVDEDTGEMLADFLADFRCDHEREGEPLLLLREALYSTANDFVLFDYLIWPAMNVPDDLRNAMDSNFDMWRFGIKVEFLDDHSVLVKLPEQ